MKYYVKEMTDKCAILMAEDGYELAKFPSVQLAVSICLKECGTNPLYIERHYSYLENSPNDFESSYI